MKRIHLFEFEDQTWFPKFLRNYVIDFLQFLSNKAKVYEPVVDVIVETLEKSKTNTIIDLGSGGGGGLLWLGNKLKDTNPEIHIVLTDYYPNISAFEYTQTQSKVFSYVSNQVDARHVPDNLQGLRTMFLSFHHFVPNDALQILQSAVDGKKSIAVFEIQDRSIPSIIAMLLSPISVLFVTPFIKPFDIGRLFFTYLIPVVPLVVLWDGIVSCLRTYTTSEMRKLVNNVEQHDTYDWSFEKRTSKTGFVIYTIGIPKAKL